MSRYFKVGKLAATYGFKGDMILKHNLGKKTALKGLTTVFIENGKDSFLPYFIQKATARDAGEVLLKLEGHESKESCKPLLQKEIWILQEDFERLASKSAPISFLGYNIRADEDIIGEVTEVIEQPHQILCKIMYKGHEALIPVHENNLLKVDKKNRILDIELPEGLLDIYSK